MGTVNDSAVAVCRAALITGLTFIAWNSSIDAQVQSCWSWLAAQRLVQHDTFEPAVVAVSFLVWHAVFWGMDGCSSLKPWRISASQDMRHWNYFLPILLFDWMYPRRWLPKRAPSALRLFLEVVGGLFLYDIFFFCVHYSCHKVPYLYRTVHAKHHAKPVQRATETLRLALPEVVLDTLCSVGALNVLGAHPFSRLVYNIVITYLLTELHGGYDMPWMMQNIVPLGIWGGSRRHEQHHKLGHGNYQKFFTYIDDWIESQAL